MRSITNIHLPERQAGESREDYKRRRKASQLIALRMRRPDLFQSVIMKPSVSIDEPPKRRPSNNSLLLRSLQQFLGISK